MNLKERGKDFMPIIGKDLNESPGHSLKEVTNLINKGNRVSKIWVKKSGVTIIAFESGYWYEASSFSVGQNKKAYALYKLIKKIDPLYTKDSFSESVIYYLNDKLDYKWEPIKGFTQL
jgi:hypothetical protein